jgi:hypothetical protein
MIIDLMVEISTTLLQKSLVSLRISYLSPEISLS